MGLSVTSVGEDNSLKEQHLKKHVAIIHCSNTLSLLQRKISNALLYHAYNELLTREEHEISVKQLCKLIAYQGHNHAAIKDAFKGLISTVIEWNLGSESEKEDWTASAILASVNLKGPLCTYAYSPRMKQLLHTPSMFGKINLFIQSHFKSSYGLALYENCIRYRGLPHTKWFELELFRKLMGVPSDKYPIFRDFKKRVLDKSIEEVNTYSDLLVEAELTKEGRHTTKVRFLLKERIKKTRIGSNIKRDNRALAESLIAKLTTGYGLTAEMAEQLLEEYGNEFIEDKIQLIEGSVSYQQGKVENLSGYLLSALKGNYQPPKSSAETMQVKLAEVSAKKSEAKEQEKSLLLYKKAYNRYRDKTVQEALDKLPEETRQNLITRFYQVAEASINAILNVLKGYTRETVLNAPMIKETFNQFVLDELPSLKSQLQSFEVFINDSSMNLSSLT